MTTPAIKSPPKASPYRFEINSNARHSSRVPIPLYPKGTVDLSETVAYQAAYYFTDFEVLAHEAANPLELFGPTVRIPYPIVPGRYLTIEGRATTSPYGNNFRHSATVVIRLLEPTTVARVCLLGNLLISPTYDARGPARNFGLPKTIRIYAFDDWPSIITVQTPPPHPRDWRLIYENTDLRGLWGWTPLDFHPVHCLYLMFVMSELPVVSEKGKIRGISIQRLGIHAYAQSINSDPAVDFAPVCSWQSAYEPQPNPFVSKFWQARGVGTVIQADHQSIYRDELPGYKYLNGADLLPSALVGLPAQYQPNAPGVITAPDPYQVTPDGYIYCALYSGDVILGDRTISTNLVLQVIEDEAPFVEGLLLEEPLPRRVENALDPARYPDSSIKVYYTDDPAIAFSPNPAHPGWIPLGVFPFEVTYVPFNVKLLFAHEVNARFYRLEHSLTAGAAFPLPRRFELSGLKVLRSMHRPLVPCKAEILNLDEIRIRLTGKNLLDDYACIDGSDIMDLIFEFSPRARPFQPFLGLRTLLDVREKTRSQIFANARATRPKKQEWHERGLQGTFVPLYAQADGTAAATRTRQSVDPTVSRQRTVTASKQTSMLNAATDPGVDAKIGQDSEIAALISALSGITTDRDSRLGALTQQLQVLKVISHLLGMNLTKLKKLIKNTSHWSDKDLKDLVSLLPGGDSFVMPEIPKIDPVSTINPGAVLTNFLYPAVSLLSLPQRPSVSMSGSFGGQFFGGGSAGLSIQLDGGKSTAQSIGTQGTANESITKYEYSDVTNQSDIERADVSRHVTRVEYVDRMQEYVWKGKEIQFANEHMDIILMTIPARLALRPSRDPKDFPDRFRIRIGYLPPSVELDVTFLGTATPQEKE